MANFNCYLCSKQYKYLTHFKNHLNLKHNIDFGYDEDINSAVINSLNNLDITTNNQIQTTISEISNQDCILCMGKPKTTAFFRCGHRCCCEKCAIKILKLPKKNRKCPICRKEVVETLRIYD